MEPLLGPPRAYVLVALVVPGVWLLARAHPSADDRPRLRAVLPLGRTVVLWVSGVDLV